MIESAALGRKTVRGLIEIRSTYVLCRVFQICLCKEKKIKKILKHVEDESARRMEHIYQQSKLINHYSFLTRIKIDMNEQF